MDAELDRRLEQSGYGRPGFAARYDAFRPRPPEALLDLLPPLAGVERPGLVVDLGSGTGLSTRPWAARADEVVGVDANEAMVQQAETETEAPNVRYINVSSYGTGLPDGCADLVTAAQSLQWMRPERVFPEIERILRTGGVFCAYEYYALQTPRWEPEEAFGAAIARMRELRVERGLDRERQTWPVSRERLEESNAFRFVRELALHSIEEGDGERLVGFALSQGSLSTLLEAGATEEEIGLDQLRTEARRMGGPMTWWIPYRVWVGLR